MRIVSDTWRNSPRPSSFGASQKVGRLGDALRAEKQATLRTTTGGGGGGGGDGDEAAASAAAAALSAAEAAAVEAETRAASAEALVVALRERLVDAEEAAADLAAEAANMSGSGGKGAALALTAEGHGSLKAGEGRPPVHPSSLSTGADGGSDGRGATGGILDLDAPSPLLDFVVSAHEAVEALK